jgi:4-amino-4-deoxy-L-arabinose transferase-like glycosyltransferase
MWIRRSPWLAPTLVGVLALAVRLPQLDQVAHIDELYHLLPARAWLAEGELRIAEGTYERAPLFTLLLAATFALLGESLVVARLPSVLAGTALVVVLFLWTRREAGPLAAWVAALLLALWSEGIAISQFARFYAVHGLLVFGGAIAVYAIVHRQTGWRLRLATALGAGLAFVLALQLQDTTLILLAGLGLWLGLVLVLPWLLHEERAPAWRWGAGLALLLAPALALLLLPILLETEAVAVMWHAMFDTPLWSARQAGRYWYYHGLFSLSHPLLWSLLGVIALLALAHRPRPALFCLVVFATAFLLHSIAARKHVRYVYYALPFLFVLAGIAAQAVLPRLWAWLVARALNATAALGLRPRQWLAGLLAGLALAFALLAQPDLIRAAAGRAGIFLPPERPPTDWAAVQPALAPWVAQAGVVLTTNELAALYYLGRYDLLISKSRLSEIGDPDDDFARDYRTGRPVVSTPEAVARIIDCHATGVVVSEEGRWRSPNQLDDPVADLIVRRAAEIPLPARHRMRAYAWEQPGAAPPGSCDDLPALSAPGAGGAQARG